jgi:hypothetical protein
MSTPSRFAVLFAGVLLAFSAFAQPEDRSAADPPTRVARLSYIHGDVSFVPAGENDWVEARLNRPIVSGDKLWTDRNSRTELEIGAAAIRMDQQTSFDFLNLDDNTAQMELTQGALNLRVRRLYDGQSYEIDTPTLAFIVNRVGEYRVDVDADGRSTIVSVLHGAGEVYGEGGARFRVEEGQSITFHDPQLQDYQTSDLPPPDAFDEFCLQRDHRWDEAPARHYVHEEVIGYEDLDDYGSWDDVPQYGHVWYPTTVAVGWAPYHYGHWSWIGAYGWTWVDDAPWGFAPFHYGRWVFVGNRWGWCPGPLVVDVRPVYAPALVAFIGGGGVSVGVSVGGPIGWFPLGWGDPYFPAYHVSYNYFRNVNVSNTVINNTVINNYYGNFSSGNINYSQVNFVNRGVAGAVTAVPASAFVSARPVQQAAVAVAPNTFQNARIMPVAAVAPTRASLAPAVAAKAAPPAAVLNRPIVAATKPPAPIAPFAQRAPLLAKNPGQPLPIHQLRAATPAAGNAAAAGAAKVRVVTQTGTPLHGNAPALPARPAAAAATTPEAKNGRGALPAVQNNATPANGKVGAVGGRPGVNATQTQHVESARFAHPGGGNEGKSKTEALPARTTGGEATHVGGRGSVNATQTQHVDSARFAHPGGGNEGKPKTEALPARTSGGEATHVGGRPAVNATQTQTQHVDSARFAHPAGNEGAAKSHTPIESTRGSSYTPPKSTNAVRSEERVNTPSSGYGSHNYGTTTNQPQYHKPSPPQQEYRAPTNVPRNEYHPAPTSQPKPEYHAPVQTPHTPPQQAAPAVHTPPPQQMAPAGRTPPPPPPHGNDKNKDDDKKHGGGH